MTEQEGAELDRPDTRARIAWMGWHLGVNIQEAATLKHVHFAILKQDSG